MEPLFGFVCRKWTIIILCATILILQLIPGVVVLANIDPFINDMSKRGLELTKTQVILLVILLESLTMMVHMIGLIGAIKEHFCLSLTFTIIFTFSMIKTIVDLTHDHKYWIQMIIMSTLMFIQVLFVYDIYRMRSSKSNDESPPSSSSKKAMGKENQSATNKV